MRRKTLLHALIVAHACALASCGDENHPSVIPDPPCNAGIYPAAPDGASAQVYVSAACPAVGADGSAAHPFPTIMEALPRAVSGAAVLIAPGTYTENLTISQEVALVGSSDPTSPAAAAAVIEAKSEHAITVTGNKKVTLRGLRVVKAAGTGIRVQGAPVTIEGCSIEDTSVPTGGVSGYGAGVVSTDDASIILQHSAVVRAAGFGVYVGSARAIILQSTIHGSGGPGIRIDRSTDQVRIEDSTIEDSTQIGIGVFSSRAIILQNVIKGTRLDSAKIGDGVIVTSAEENGVPQGPADVELRGNEITNNARVGVLCAAGARGIILQNNTVAQNGEIASRGAGVWLQGGAGGAAENVIEGNMILSNRFTGIGLTGDTHAIILQNNTIYGTQAGTTFVGTDMVDVGGDGIGLFSNASARLLGNMIEKNDRCGLILDQAGGAATTIVGNTFQDNNQYGIILQNQMNAPATADNTYQGNAIGDMDSVPAGTFGVNTSAFATK